MKCLVLPACSFFDEQYFIVWYKFVYAIGLLCKFLDYNLLFHCLNRLYKYNLLLWPTFLNNG